MRRDRTDARSGGGAGESPERFERDRSEEPSTAIVEAVAAATGRDPGTLSPLDEHVDTEALASLLAHGSDPDDERPRVSFGYEGVDVTVDAGGGITVRADDTGPERAPLEPTTDAELSAMLGDLLRGAFRNGLSVQGGWEARNGPEYPDWDVVVTLMEKPPDENARGRS